MTAILKEDPPELSAMAPAVSPEVERIVRRCLEKQPASTVSVASQLQLEIGAGGPV